MDFFDIIIRSEDILLVPISFDYAEDIFREFRGDITTYMYPKPPDKIKETEDFIRESLEEMEKGNNIQLVILKADTEEFLGCTGAHKINTLTPELGIWLKRSARGNKYGINAIRLLVDWARKNIKYDFFKYPVDRRNLPSRRIPESFGATIKDEFRCVGESKNELDIVEYQFR
ncbi:MAG TPA: GNAT family N-acetyltransferase [Spirochaetota bacterium]|nr:GNAT family N-acetyltransferase [Spirochaetota bacterium]